MIGTRSTFISTATTQEKININSSEYDIEPETNNETDPNFITAILVIVTSLMIFIAAIVGICVFRVYKAHSRKNIPLTQVDSHSKEQKNINVIHSTNRESSIEILDVQTQEGKNANINALVEDDVQIEGDNHDQLFDAQQNTDQAHNYNTKQVQLVEVQDGIEEERQKVLETNKLNEIEFGNNVAQDIVVENALMDDIVHHIDTSK